MTEQIPGGWSPLPGEKPSDEIIKYTTQVKTQTEQTVRANFKKFQAILVRQQRVAGMNYVVEVDVGEADNYVHVQFFVALPVNGGGVEYKTAAQGFKKNAPLEPLI